METVKIKDKRTGAIKIVKKSLASDYIGTGNFEIAKEEKTPSKFALEKENPEEK